MTHHENNKGHLEVICGSMFSGKSEELIRRLKRAEIARKNVIAFKHALDDRKAIAHLTSHNGTTIKAFAIDKPEMILKLTHENIDIVGIDEIQFFPTEIIGCIIALIDQGKEVIVSGLDLDFRGVPFGCIPGLLSIADKITKLTAICIKCGKDAYYTQRLVDGKPAKISDPLILIGAEDCYQARCRDCFSIDKMPTWYRSESLNK